MLDELKLPHKICTFLQYFACTTLQLMVRDDTLNMAFTQNILKINKYFVFLFLNSKVFPKFYI